MISVLNISHKGAVCPKLVWGSVQGSTCMPIVLIDSVSERMSHPCLRLLGLVLRGCDLEQGCLADLFVCVCMRERVKVQI